jgi:hypothetical protein
MTPFGEIESRMGLPPIEELLAERDELVKHVAPLRAKHGPFGTWDALRKVELATIAASLRARAVAEEPPRKMTEAAIDEAAHSDGRYAAFIAAGTQEKADWAVQENAIQGIADTINRGQAVARYLAAEVPLTPR